jgi:hypothetical protein
MQNQVAGEPPLHGVVKFVMLSPAALQGSFSQEREMLIFCTEHSWILYICGKSGGISQPSYPFCLVTHVPVPAPVPAQNILASQKSINQDRHRVSLTEQRSQGTHGTA